VRKLALSVLGLGLVFAASGCRFERRADLTNGGALDLELRSEPGSGPMEDSVRVVVNAIAEALHMGDVARVARLTVPGAMLIDQEDAVRWVRDSPTMATPRALTPRSATAAWALASSDFAALGSAALVVNEYVGVVPAGGGPLKEVETYVLVRTDEGWRLRHLHRSHGSPRD